MKTLLVTEGLNITKLIFANETEKFVNKHAPCPTKYKFFDENSIEKIV